MDLVADRDYSPIVAQLFIVADIVGVLGALLGHEVRTASAGEEGRSVPRAASLPDALVLEVDRPVLGGPDMAPPSPLPAERSHGPFSLARMPVWGWVAVILAAVYSPMFTGAIIFFRDPAHWNTPARWFLHASLRRGELPWWNPDQGLGFPVLGDPLYGLFYPLNWLFALGDADTVARMVTWQSFAHLVWGSAGISLLATRLGSGRAGAVVAGLTWGLSGYTTAMWTAGLLLPAGAWLPWCAVGFLALGRGLDGPADDCLMGIVKAAVPVGMAILMGEIFVALMGIGFGLLTAAVAHMTGMTGGPLPAGVGLGGGERDGARLTAGTGSRWSSMHGGYRALPVVAALGLGLGLGAITVLPARALSAATQRAHPLSRVLAETCSLHPLRLIEMLVPGAMGDAYEDYPAGAIVGEPLVDGLPLSFSVYMGAASLALALAAFGRGRQRRGALLLGGCAIGALVLALGKHTPLHQWVRTVVWPLAYMRYPEKYLVLFVAWLALLAGLGATRWLSADQQHRPWRRSAILLAALVVIWILAGLRASFPVALDPFLRRGAIAAGGAILGVLAGGWLWSRRPGTAVALMVASVTLDLATAAWPLQVFQPASLATDVPRAARAILEDRGTTVAPARVYRADRTEGTVRAWVPVRNFALGEFRSVQTLVPNTLTTFGLASLPGYDAAIPSVLRLLWVQGEARGPDVLRLLGVGYAVLPIDDPRDPVEHRPDLVPLMDPLPGSRLYRVPGTLPRVYLVARQQTEVLADEDAFPRVLDADVVAGRRVLLASSAVGPASADPSNEPPSRHGDGDAGRAGDCALTGFGNNRVAAHCRVQRPGVAVFIEQFDSGWRATVDGRPASLQRANGLLRAVSVDRGEHDIVLSYSPPALAAGAGVSLAAAILLVAIAALSRVARALRKRPAGP
jgi:hypothetical protein